MPGLGEAFRAAREARNLSLSDVAEQIHIRSVYLQAIEEENWSAIVAPVYVRGFIRTYARFLGIDPQSAIEGFNGMAGEPGPPPPIPATITRTSRGPSILLWIAAATAAVLVGLVAYNYFDLQRSDHTSSSDVAGVTSPGAAASPGASAEAGAAVPLATAEALATPKPAALSVRIVERSWLRIVVDGDNKMEGIFAPGTVRQFEGKVAIVRAGNAAGVDVIVHGKDQGTLGAPGDVVEKTYELAQQ